MKKFLTIALILSVGAVAARGQCSHTGAATDAKGAMALYTPADIKWKDGPGSLQKGAKMMLLEGDPTQEGMFTMRLWFPDGFEVKPHFHSQIEHVTILQGALNIGMGDKFDRSATKEMSVATFGFWPPGMKHFAWAKGDTILQLHGRGPWTVTYVNPADDPRKPK
jgi:hypothetical protein